MMDDPQTPFGPAQQRTRARPPIPPHPRIRQRRVEVRRDEGRRRLRILVIGLGVAALVGAGYGVTRSTLLDVDMVHLRGATNTARHEVLAAAGLDQRRAMIDIDEESIAARVEALPWVKAATVVRRFPGTIDVTLQERTPVAAVPAGAAGWALVDDDGRVLAHHPEPPPGLARVEAAPAGPPGSRVPTATRAALQVLQSLPEVLSGRVPSVRVADGGSMELRLDGKVPVAFGLPNRAEAKLVALATLVQKADLARVRSIDIRVPTAPVLTRA